METEDDIIQGDKHSGTKPAKINKLTFKKSKAWQKVRISLQRLVCWPFHSRSPGVCWWEGPWVVEGWVSVCVCVCQGKGKADELHFLLAADRGSPARSPINRLKDKGVKKMKDPSLSGWLWEKRGEERERGGRQEWECEKDTAIQKLIIKQIESVKCVNVWVFACVSAPEHMHG